MTDSEAAGLEYDWRFWARPKQLAPDGAWNVWLLRAGRGFGKTRSISGWIHERAMQRASRWIALVARTPADARDYNIEGPGGILKNVSPIERPDYEPSKRRLTWPNGSWATIFSDEEPDQLRGFSGDTAVLDEFAKFKNAVDTWDMLQFGMRECSDDQPRIMIATTPRPIPILKKIESLPGTRVVTGSSRENMTNLDRRWFDETLAPYVGTRLGRQEIEAEYVEEVTGALWTRSQLDALRIRRVPELYRIVVGVDPSGTSGSENDRPNSVGIVAVGLGVDGGAYVLADRSCSMSPAGWARRISETYDEFGADAVIAEINYGGAMVEAVVRAADPLMNVRIVHASRGKHVRAEPVAALYERGRVHHVGAFEALEDQMSYMTVSGYVGKDSPDRVDALVWAITELVLNDAGNYDASMKWV